MVEREFGGWETPAAILAVISVACEEVSTVKLYIVFGEPVVKKKANDSGDGDIEIDGRDPVAGVGLEVVFEPADLAPALEVVIIVGSFFEGYNFGELLIEKRKSTPGVDDTDCHIVLV
jgi:hypothetical protein